MSERKDPQPDDAPEADDRIPVLNIRATPEDLESSPQSQEAGAVDDETIQALADHILDRIAPILHDALVEEISDYLAERDKPQD